MPETCAMEEVKPGKWVCETHGTWGYGRTAPICEGADDPQPARLPETTGGAN